MAKKLKTSNKNTKNGTFIRNIKIGPKTYKLVRKSNLKNDDGILCDGLFEYSNSIINLDTDMDKPTEWIILWHECLHAILAQCGGKQDERLVEGVSHGIVDLLQNNPWMGKSENFLK